MNHPQQPIQIEILEFNNAKKVNALTHLQNEAASLLSLYTKNLRVILDKWKITTPPAITLRMNEEGHLYVEGTHQDKVKLDHILNAKEALRDDFIELEVLHCMVYRITHGSKVGNEYFAVALTSLGGIALFFK